MKFKHLESRPERASGELTIKGTRIRIAQVINMLANGFTMDRYRHHTLSGVWPPAPGALPPTGGAGHQP